MALLKITETEIPDELSKKAYVLITQPEPDDDGVDVESLRRVPLNVLFAGINQELADLKYEPVKITSISNSVGTVEMGSTVDTLTINWKLNKEPVSQTVNGENVEASARSAVLNDLQLTATKSFAVAVTDEREATASETTAVTFLNGVYYGVLEDGTTLDSAAVLTLTRKLQGSKALTFTVNATASQRLAYATPSRYGTPVFNIGGFEYEWEKTTIEFTNQSGYTESYDVWLSGQTGLGSTTVKVS